MSDQAFVKFLGSSRNRAQLTDSTIGTITWTGCHKVVAYSRRPRSVRDGDLIFISRFVSEPDDIRIFGRAIGRGYKYGNDATLADIDLRSWMEQYPHLVRLHRAEFIDGRLEDGVSLNEMTWELGAASFASTLRNQRRGEGNTNLRLAYRQHGHVSLTERSFLWLQERLDAALSRRMVDLDRHPLDSREVIIAHQRRYADLAPRKPLRMLYESEPMREEVTHKLQDAIQAHPTGTRPRPSYPKPSPRPRPKDE